MATTKPEKVKKQTLISSQTIKLDFRQKKKKRKKNKTDPKFHQQTHLANGANNHPPVKLPQETP